MDPVWANVSGLGCGEGRFNDPTTAGHKEREQLRQKTLKALDGVAVQGLTGDQHLDRLALRSKLLAECEDFDRGIHELDPGAVDEFFGILLHELQRGEDAPRRARMNIRQLLKKAPIFLKQSARVVKAPERVWRRIMLQTVAGSRALFDAVNQFTQGRDVELIQAAQAAVFQYRDAVMQRPLAPAKSFALGAERLQRRVRDELGLDYTLSEIESLALSEAKRIGRLLKEACARHEGRKSSRQIIEAARKQWRPEGELLDLYCSETARVANGFKKARAVTFPKEDTLDVRLVPELMRHLYPTAAYSSPGRFEKHQRGIFWVNDLSLTKSDSADQLAEVQQHFGISLTAAHEAYPGHHLQFVTANTHSRLWRPLFAHAVFYEGWTLWCEQMCVDLGIIESPELKLQQLHDALWRCHRILVDLRLQTGAYSYAQAVRHMQKHLGFTKARAEADVNWYTGSPGVPMSYWLGRIENARLHRKLVEGRGWSLRRGRWRGRRVRSCRPRSCRSASSRPAGRS